MKKSQSRDSQASQLFLQISLPVRPHTDHKVIDSQQQKTFFCDVAVISPAVLFAQQQRAIVKFHISTYTGLLWTPAAWT